MKALNWNHQEPFRSGSEGHRSPAAANRGNGITLALIGSSLLFSSTYTNTAEGFENGREFLWNMMLRCQAGWAACQEVHALPQPSQCVSAPITGGQMGALKPYPCQAPYVISQPDTGPPHRQQTLLVPGSSSATTTGGYTAIPDYPVSGIEAYQSRDKTEIKWLPNYFAFAADFAWAHYRGPNNSHWVVAAMNPANVRSQDQLHIHMCNLDPNITIVSPALGQKDVWMDMGLKVENKAYRTMWLSRPVTKNDALSNPFTKVFRPEAPQGGVGGVPRSQRADVTLALVISPAGQNFLLYNTEGGAAESLLPQKNVACDFK